MSTFLEETFGLAARAALVAGADGVIGSAIALALGRAGARLIVAGSDGERLLTLVAELGGQEACLALQADLADEETAVSTIDRAMGYAGRLDVIFCAAQSAQRPDAIYELESDEWRRALRENLDAAFYGAREAARAMVEQGGGGKIVLLSSPLVPRANRRRPAAAVAAASSAAAALVRQLAVELAPYRVTVNGLAPGGLRSPAQGPEIWGHPRLEEDLKGQILLGRIGEPSEIQGAALFLASRASDFVTGQILTVDGGWSL